MNTKPEVVATLKDGKVVLFIRGDAKRQTAVIHYRIAIPGLKGYERKSTKTANVEDATQVAIARYNKLYFEHTQGRTALPKSYKAVAEEYLDDIKDHVGNPIKHKTQSVAINYLLSRFATKAIDSFTEVDLHAYADWRKRQFKKKNSTQAQKKKGITYNLSDTPVSMNTVALELTAHHNVLSFAVRRGYMDRSKIPDHGWVRKKRNPRPAFSEEQVKKIMTEVDGWSQKNPRTHVTYLRMRMQALCGVLAYSGIRIGEAKKLKWGQVQNDNNGMILMVATGKRSSNPRGERTVQPMPDVYEILGNWKMHQTQYHGEAPKDTDFVFMDQNKNAPVDMASALKAFLKNIGITADAYGNKFTLYSFRHYYATNRLEASVDVYAIARNMGTSVEELESTYGHVRNEAARKQLDKGLDQTPQAKAKAELDAMVADAKRRGY